MKRQLEFWDDECPGTQVKSSATESKPNAEDAQSDLAQASTNESVWQLFTNPDRQFHLDGADPYKQPHAGNDEETISIDRLRHDVDGPPHRFVIRLQDFIEVFTGGNKIDYGTVIGIVHDRRQVRVSFAEEGEGDWFDVGNIFPARQPKRQKPDRNRYRIHETQEVLTIRSSVAEQVDSMANYTSVKVVSLVRTGSLEGRAKIASTADACRFFLKFWEENPGHDQERFIVACLDTKHCVQSVVPITVGTLDASLVHPREVFKPAIIESSSAILLSHNHPSGDPTPSKEDLAVTKRLTEAGELLGITVLDHIVHGDGSGKVISIRET